MNVENIDSSLRFDEDYSIRQAYKNKLQEMYYNYVVLNDQDMLVDGNDQVILFGTKIVVRRYCWNEKTQTFDKVPTGVVRGAGKRHTEMLAKKGQNLEQQVPQEEEPVV